MEYKYFGGIMIYLPSVRSFILVFSSFLSLSALSAPQYLDGHTLEPVQLTEKMQQIQPGTVLILGEMHNVPAISRQHVDILQALRDQGLKVSVGMEFFNYTDQMFVDQYRTGELSDEAFKSLINWGGYDFELYKRQILFPKSELGEFGLGINLSRAVTGAISKGGLDSLTEDQKKLLPPQFTLGRDSYRTRFFEAMGVTHPTPKLENYFVAQSAWDDTMAWQTVNFLKDHPDHVFVIIVGEFHVQYGGGLPDRLRTRMQAAGLNHPIQTVSQILTEGLTPEDIQKEIMPSETEGARADYIILN